GRSTDDNGSASSAANCLAWIWWARRFAPSPTLQPLQSEQRRYVHFRGDLLALIFGIVHAIRQDHGLAVHLAIGDLRQQMRDAVEPCALLVDGLDHPPRRFRNMGPVQHLFLRLRVLLPARARLHVHRAQLPLLQGIMDAHQKAELLFLVGDREPVFDQDDAGTHQHALELGHGVEELLDLLLGRKAHHALDTGAIVPGAVEQHDLAASRQMRDIALEIPLRALALARRRERGDAADPRVEALGDALDHSALAGGVAALEDHDHLELVVLDPILQLDQLALQAKQLLEIDVPVQRRNALAGELRGPELLEFIVRQFKLELFVQAVPEVGPNKLVYGLVVAAIHLRSSRLTLDTPDFPMTFDGGVTTFGADARY